MNTDGTSGLRATRRRRRALGKRRLRREAHRDVVRVLERAESGSSPAAIAASVGLKEELVREILRIAEARRGDMPARMRAAPEARGADPR